MLILKAAFGFIALAGLSAGTAVAQQQQQFSQGVAVTGATSAADKDSGRLVCRNLRLTGSRVSERVCATKIEWEEQTKRNAQELLDGQQDSDRRSFLDPKSMPN